MWMMELEDYLACLEFRISNAEDVQALEYGTLPYLSEQSARLVLLETFKGFLPSLETILCCDPASDGESTTSTDDVAEDDLVPPIEAAPYEEIVDSVPWMLATMPDRDPNSFAPIMALLVKKSSKLAFKLCGVSIAFLEDKVNAIFQEVQKSFSDSSASSTLPTLGFSTVRQLLHELRIQITSEEALGKIDQKDHNGISGCMAVATTRAIQALLISEPLMKPILGLDHFSSQISSEIKWTPAPSSTPSNLINIDKLWDSAMTQQGHLWDNFTQVYCDIQRLHDVFRSMGELMLPSHVFQCHRSCIQDLAVTAVRLVSMQIGCREFFEAHTQQLRILAHASFGGG
jgi:hypothetical protein